MATIQMQRVAVSPQEQANIYAAKKNRIQVSNTKKPLFFYVNLAKAKRAREHNSCNSSMLRPDLDEGKKSLKTNSFFATAPPASPVS